MAKSGNLPHYVLRLKSYADLRRYAAAFAEGHLNLLLLCGAPGLGKSRCVREALGPSAFWVDGSATAFGIYLAAYEHRDRPLVLDDVDGLHRDRAGVRLLKALCQTERVKSVSWQSDSKTLERRRIPRQFTTSSRLVVIANYWESLDADVAALEDRGHVVLFEPDAAEVHRHAATWYWDQEVFDFVADHLYLLERPSLRTYVRAWELKQAGLDWRNGVLSRCLKGTSLAVARLKADPAYAAEEDRVRAFVASGAGSRATYFVHAKQLRPVEVPPRMLLSHSAPPAAARPCPDVLGRLRDRFRDPEKN
jgi:hypothetical protein